MRKIAKKVLDETFHTDLSGPSRDFAESSSNTSFALVLALLFIYLILAFQFESFREPFIIMLTVPLAMAGAMLSLWIFDMTLNIFSEIGMIMLIGLVTKNGILIVEFANQKRKAGLVETGSGVRGGGRAAAADPHDLAGHDFRRHAHCVGTRRRRGKPHAAGDRGRGRIVFRAGPDAVHHSRHVCTDWEKQKTGTGDAGRGRGALK